MTSLMLSNNDLKHGWEHLRLLRQLEELTLEFCGLTEVSTALAGVESVNLRSNRIEWGWQHLRSLTRLRKLKADVDERYS